MLWLPNHFNATPKHLSKTRATFAPSWLPGNQKKCFGRCQHLGSQPPASTFTRQMHFASHSYSKIIGLTNQTRVQDLISGLAWSDCHTLMCGLRGICLDVGVIINVHAFPDSCLDSLISCCCSLITECNHSSAHWDEILIEHQLIRYPDSLYGIQTNYQTWFIL